MGDSESKDFAILHSTLELGVNMSRTRTIRGGKPPSGTIIRNPGPGQTTFTQDTNLFQDVYSSVCTDTVGNWDHDNGLDIDRMEYHTYQLNGLNQSQNRLYTNWTPQGIALAAISHINDSSLPSLTNATNNALARSNPSKPVIDAPRSILELKDIPETIRQAASVVLDFRRGRLNPRSARNAWNALRHGAGAYVGYEFGIRPIVSDVNRLLKFQESWDRRFHELKRLYSTGGLRKTGRIYSSTKSDGDSSKAIESVSSLVINARQERITTREMWYSARWKPDWPRLNQSWAQHVSPNDAAIRRQAYQAITGANLNPVVIYDLIPWSWLGDWFTNFHDMLASNSYSVPAVCDSVCIMTHTKTVVSWRQLNEIQLAGTQGGLAYALREHKERAVGSGSNYPTATIPTLNGWQLSILGALGVSRGIRRTH